MSDTEDFTPRLGRPADRGDGAGKRYAARVKRAVKRLVKPKGKAGYSGVRSGRGAAAARMAAMRGHPFAPFRMRRAVVKVYIARARQGIAKGIGATAFRAHLNYIQRDGVDRVDGRTFDQEMGAARDDRARPGVLYGRDGDHPDDAGFLARSENDPRQFRIIVSPEDGDQLDLRENTRTLMARVERDLGTRLDWVAVDHHNTDRPHTHIVVRGRDARGKDLVIAREYVKHGLRDRAEAIVMERLGPRRDLEIARARAAEATRDRLTGLDQRLARLERGGLVRLAPAKDSYERFDRRLCAQRLAHLERLGLAAELKDGTYRLVDDWADRLSDMGLKGDVIRQIAAVHGRKLAAKNVRLFEAGSPRQPSVLGRVVANAPDDELRDVRALIVEDLDGVAWRVPTDERLAGAMPPIGAVVEAASASTKARPADRVIAAVAEAHGGRYSADRHQAEDPSSTPAFLEAHKRRLEALRRAGHVERLDDGDWIVGPDYLDRAAQYEARRGAARLTVKSWLALDPQTERRGPVWLDDLGDARDLDHGAGRFAKDLRAAREKRGAFLRREGFWSEAERGIGAAARRRMAAAEVEAAGDAISEARGLAFRRLPDGGRFDGVYERAVDLGQGRFALVTSTREFALVPWRPELERQRGRALAIRRRGKGVSWSIEPGRGPTRA